MKASLQKILAKYQTWDSRPNNVLQWLISSYFAYSYKAGAFLFEILIYVWFGQYKKDHSYKY